MKRVKIIFVILIITLTGCFIIPPPAGYYNPYCYDGKDTGLDSLINVNGYYLVNDSVNDNGNIIPPQKRTNFILIFYEDGIFVHSLFLENSDYNEKYLDWGLYKIYNDTLKVRFSIPRIKKWRPVSKAWYKIRDKNTIEALAFSYWGEITQKNIYKRDRVLYAKFIPCDTLPDPNKSYVKKDRVFWCNKEQYKKWKKEQKLKRKQTK